MAMNRQRRTANISNIFSYDDAGNIVIKDYSQVIRYSWNGTIHGFIGPVSVSSVAAAVTDTDKFLVSDGGVLKFRTGAEVLSDIGGQPLLTNPVTGTGVAGQVAYWNGTNSQTGSNNLFWDAANSYLGIKRTNPIVEIDVVGSIRASATVFSSTTQTNNIQTNGQNLAIKGAANTYATMFQSTGNFVLQNGGTFTDGGQRLQVQGTTLLNGNVKIGNTVYSDSAANLIVGIDGATTRAVFANNATYQDLMFVNTSISSGSINSWAFGQRRDTAFGNQLGSFQIVGAYASNGGVISAVGGGYRVPLICNPDGSVIIAGASANAVNGDVAIGTTTLGAATKLTIGGSETASSAIARGGLVNTTLVASANNDVLVGLDVNPTFTNGAFTGVTNFGGRFISSVTNNFEAIQVRNTQASATGQTRIKFDNESTVSTTSGGVIFYTSNGYIGYPQNSFGFWNHTSNGIIALATNNTERLRLTAAGRLLLGTTTESTYLLDVNGTARFGNIFPQTPNVTNIGDASNYFSTAFFQTANINTCNGNILSYNSFKLTTNDLVFNTSASVSIARLYNSTGNLVLQNGGTFTDGGQRLQVQGTSYFSDRVGFNSTGTSNVTLRNELQISGSSSSYGYYTSSVIQSGVTNQASYFLVSPQTQAASFTLSRLSGFEVTALGIGGGSTITEASAFYGGISSGFNHWNLYMAGTANNYMAGNLLIGTTSDQGYRVQITGSGDNMLSVWGATAPSIRIDNAASGATQRFVFGLATATNNFITGAVAGDICMTTQSSNPLLFGANALEVMRITTSRNLLIGTSTDVGAKLRVFGDISCSVDLRLTRTGTSPAIILDQTQLRLVNQTTGFTIGLNVENDIIRFGGAIRTTPPSGSGNPEYKLGSYSATAPTATGYLNIEVGGVVYKVLAST